MINGLESLEALNQLGLFDMLTIEMLHRFAPHETGLISYDVTNSTREHLTVR